MSHLEYASEEPESAGHGPVDVFLLAIGEPGKGRSVYAGILTRSTGRAPILSVGVAPEALPGLKKQWDQTLQQYKAVYTVRECAKAVRKLMLTENHKDVPTEEEIIGATLQTLELGPDGLCFQS